MLPRAALTGVIGDPVSLRRVLLVALMSSMASVAGVTAASAASPDSVPRQHQRRVSAITFTPHGDGTVIRITVCGPDTLRGAGDRVDRCRSTRSPLPTSTTTATSTSWPRSATASW
jgi:hypothetical protein